MLTQLLKPIIIKTKLGKLAKILVSNVGTEIFDQPSL